MAKMLFFFSAQPSRVREDLRTTETIMDGAERTSGKTPNPAIRPHFWNLKGTWFLGWQL
jgi:hypothetical protein